MDASALIGNAQTAYATGLQKQAAANAAAAQANGTVPGQMKLRPADQTKKAKDAANQFEGFFIGQMMEQMMAGIQPDENFGGGSGEEMWRSMLNQEYGKQVAKSDKLGIAAMVTKSMLHAQEQRTAAATGEPAPVLTAASTKKSDTVETNTPANQAAAAASAAYRPIKR